MTAPLPRRHLAAVLTLAAAVGLAGCGLGESTSAEPKPPPASTPPPSGDGPYEDPSDPAPAEPIPSGKAGTPKGVPKRGDVDQDDATAVSKAGLTVMAVHDTELDTSRADAERRAAAGGWCTPAYAAQLRKARPRAAPGAEWNTWHKHRAYTTVRLTRTEDAGRPSDTTTAAYRQWTLTITPRGRDGWKGSPDTSVAFVQLEREKPGAAWRLAAVSIQ